jgi:hypothetical protein
MAGRTGRALVESPISSPVGSRSHGHYSVELEAGLDHVSSADGVHVFVLP